MGKPKTYYVVLISFILLKTFHDKKVKYFQSTIQEKICTTLTLMNFKQVIKNIS